MTNRLKNKRALVTAAAQGIGESIARAFSAEGASVLAVDINTEKLSELTGPGITTATLDVTDEAALKKFVDEHEAFDILVNCAGYVANGSILNCSNEDWDFSFALNVKSMFQVSKHVLPGMVEKNKGAIVNIGSICAHAGLPNRFAYGTTKAALVGLTKSIAADFIGNNIRCNVIHPGTVQSPSLDDRIAAFDDPVAARKAFIARQPMGRLGTAEEIAAAAVYLASDESVFTTGVDIKIDGGMSI